MPEIGFGRGGAITEARSKVSDVLEGGSSSSLLQSGNVVRLQT